MQQMFGELSSQHDQVTCKTSYYFMIKTITKIGNSQGLIFDAALLELAHLKPGDEINVEVHERGDQHFNAAATSASRSGDF